MFKRVLAALDLQDTNDTVFERALKLAIATDAQLMLLHALAGDRNSPAMPIAGGWDYYAIIDDGAWSRYQSEWKAYKKRSLDTLHDFERRAKAAGISTQFSQVDQPPEQAICELASSWQADVVIVGSHGRKGLSELFLGSVSNYVMHHAPCSVLVVRDLAIPSPTAASLTHSSQATPQPQSVAS